MSMSAWATLPIQMAEKPAGDVILAVRSLTTTLGVLVPTPVDRSPVQVVVSPSTVQAACAGAASSARGSAVPALKRKRLRAPIREDFRTRLAFIERAPLAKMSAGAHALDPLQAARKPATEHQ